MNQKGFIPILIILIILFFGIIGCFGYKYLKINSSKSSPSPTSDLTANGKTYINEKYGFSIKYPEKRDDNSSPITVGEMSTINGVDGFGVSELPDGDILSFRYQKTNADLKTWWGSLLGNETKRKFATYSESEFTGNSAIEISFDQKGEFELSEYKVILIKRNGVNFEIDIPNGKIPSSSQDLQNQILTTFKFTD